MNSTSQPKVSDWAYWPAAIALFLAVCFLHFWKLGTVPNGFYLDEASVTYNAYCIALTGADEYGVPYPMFFRSFETYHDPALVYVSAPLVKVFGLRKAVARFPSALFLVMAALAFGFLVHEYGREKWLALAGMVLFSITPWMLPISRTVSSYSPMLFAMVAGWWLLLLTFRKERYWLAIGAGLSWAFAMYADNVGRPMTAIWLLCFAAAYHRSLLVRWKVGAAFVLSFVAAMIPMIVSVARFPEQLLARFRMISPFEQDVTKMEAIRACVARYLEYFNPSFLFLSGESNLRHHTGFGGELFWFTLPLIFAGISAVLRSFRTEPSVRFLALALIVSPTAAALTADRMHSIRCVPAAIAWLLLTLVGAHAMWRHKPAGRKLLLVLCAAGLVESAAYLADYFGPYQARNHKELQTAFTEALEYCFSHVQPDQVLYVSGSVGTVGSLAMDTNFKPLLYAYLLFYGKIDPRLYQQGGFSNTTVQPYLGGIAKSGLLLRCNYAPSQTGVQFMAIPNPESIPAGAKLQATFRQTPLELQVFEVN